MRFFFFFRSGKKYLFILLLVFSSFACLFSQNDTVYFRHFTYEHGLSHKNVSSIIQDSLGFMWYGTKEGLNKYDGYKFLPFKHDPKNPNSLISDDISCMAVEKSGMIWIGTRMKGVNLYNPYSGKFELFQRDEKIKFSITDDAITSIYPDTINKTIWIGTSGGLNALDPKTKKIKIYLHDQKNISSLSHNNITTVTVDGKGIVWIGTWGGGLNSFDPSTEKFTYYFKDDKNPASLSSDYIKEVFADRKNNIWAATPDGLNCLDRSENLPDDKAGKFTVFRHDDKDPNSIVSNDITSVFQDKYGKIWAGTAREGLCVYYPERGKFYLYSHEKEIQNSLSSNKINRISQGRSGMFWAATSDGGLNAFNPKTLKFNLFNPLSKINKEDSVYDKPAHIYIDKKNNLYIGTKGNGLYVFNSARNLNFSFKNESGNKTSLSNNTVNCISESSEGDLFIGTESGLNKIFSSGGKISRINFKKYLSIPKILNEFTNSEQLNRTRDSSAGEKITAVYSDKNKLLWIGTRGQGLFCYDEKNNKTINYLKNEPDKFSLSDNTISYIYEDSKNNFWIGTFGGGLNKFDRQTNKFISYKSDDKTRGSIGGNFVNTIFEDKQGRIWVTTWGGGLNMMDVQKNSFTCFTVQDGLPNNSVNNIMQDENSNYWIGTDNGICRITLSENKIKQCRIFDLIDGLPITEFYEGNSCRNNQGRIMWSCRKGLVIFHPDSIRNNPFKPPVLITDFQLFNTSIKPNDSTGILKTSISITKEIHLKYSQNSFSFEFTAISFINPGKNMYCYKLEGFDKDWNYCKASHRVATYTNIPPGKYKFRVLASNNDGIWNEKGTSIQIFISSPFYTQWWFVALCFLFGSSIVYLIYRIKIQRAREMEKIRSNIARDLHDDMGSVLSSISIYNEVAKKLTEEKVPEASAILGNMGESAKTAMDNMNDIVWAINPKNDKLGSIVSRLRIFAAQLLEAKNISLHINIDKEAEQQTLTMPQRKNIYLIFKEAVNNIAKYSEAKNCFIKITLENKTLAMRISDDGKGFESVGDTLGGNGMLNMKARAKELKGSLEINSEKNKGTTIILKFEISSNYF